MMKLFNPKKFMVDRGHVVLGLPSKPSTYFDSYEARLSALAERHGMRPEAFKALIEDAFGKCDSPPAEHEAQLALRKLAKLECGPCEINWLFQYTIL